jgi:DNA-directed RNA polymerase specialized sigma24 family protein
MLDPLLRRFVDATDDVEAERQLAEVVERHALPLAQAIVRRKLRGYADDRPVRSDARDRDDVVGDAMVTLVERLHAERSRAGASAIENFSNYAAAVVHSACAHYLRRRYPERARLKNRLRYVLSTDRRLALWMTDGELVCGLVAWRGRAADPAAGGALRSIVERREQGWATSDRAGLTVASLDLVTAVGGPVDFEALVAAVAAAARLIEPRETEDASALSSREVGHDVAIDQRRFLARVWAEIGALPPRQRAALLLNLRDPSGAGLLWLLPIAGVATIRQIAQVLDLPAREFAALWRDIPLDDAAIARRLGCTGQQVINLRMAGRKRLANRVGRENQRRTGARGAQANLAPVSTSLKGSA